MSAREEEQLARAWADKPGLVGWLSTTDHKRVGRRYLVTAMVFFAMAGALALVMRSPTTRWSARTATRSCSRCTARR